MPTYPDQEERTEPECMAHGCRWRSRFHCILNQLRANKDISKLEKSDIDRIPYAVCTCSVTPTGLQNVPDTRWNNIPIGEYEAAERYFEEFIEGLEKSTEFYSLLKYHFSDLQKHEELTERSSSRRFLLLFQKIRAQKDRELLNRPRNRERGVPQDEAQRTKQTIHLASLKKDYIPLFVGEKGKNMKRYLRGKKKVKVELEVKDNDQVFATIVCKAKDSEPIAKKLTEEAELLVERRRIHEQNQREYLERLGTGDDEDNMDTNSQEEDMDE